MLASKGRTPITQHASNYFQAVLDKTGAHLTKLDIPIFIASSYLPGNIHGDPMDRILIETARKQDLVLVTSDRAILAYGRQGHVKTLAC